MWQVRNCPVFDEKRRFTRRFSLLDPVFRGGFLGVVTTISYVVTR